MASLEKLVKSFEALKVFQPGAAIEDVSKFEFGAFRKKDQTVGKKDKVFNCNAIADCICSNSLRNIADFPKFLGISMETFLMFCDDDESDIRMVADECLNRTIKTLLETNLGRLQVELYKEIKKNGPQRSLRAALWRFADMCHLIRPQKCRPYVVNLLPCLARICRRPEEAIQETLATTMQKICPVLMPFTNDLEVKMLLKAFLPNIKSNSASTRRTASSALSLICQHSRKPGVFMAWLLVYLLDMVVPIRDDTPVHTLLGVLLTLRHMVPHMAAQSSELSADLNHPTGKPKEPELKISLDQLLQVYEVLLHYVGHADHNVVTGCLETLHQLLRHLPTELHQCLITCGGISRQTIYQVEGAFSAKSRVESQVKLPSVGDEAALEDDADGGGSEISTSGSDSTDSPPIFTDLDPDETEGQAEGQSTTSSENVSLNGAAVNGETANRPEIPTTEEMYSSIEIGDLNEDGGMSQSSSTDTLSDNKASPKRALKLRKGVSEDALNDGSIADDISAISLDISEGIAPIPTPLLSAVREGDIGTMTDNVVPLVHCTRLLCSKFLLAGYKQGLIPDRQVRVSVKALSLACVGSILAIYPRVFLKKLHKASAVPGELQDIKDILLYTSHSDHQLKGNTALLIGNLIKAALVESRGRFNKWVKGEGHQGLVSLEELVLHLIAILEDESSVATRLAIMAFKTCLWGVLNSVHSEQGLACMLVLLHLKDNPYWLVKVELLELLSEVDFKVIHYLETISDDVRKGRHHYQGHLSLQEHVLRDVIQTLGDENGRVRHAAAVALVRMVPNLFFPVDNPQHDPVIAKAKRCMLGYLEPIMHEWSHSPPPQIHGLVQPYHFNPNAHVSSTSENSLSRVVSYVVSHLNQSTSKFLTFGCCHALSRLSEEYPVTQYSAAWFCSPVLTCTRNPASILTTGLSKVETMASESVLLQVGGGLLPLIVSSLTSSPVALTLTGHQDALHLAGNIFAGLSYRTLRSPDEVAKIAPDEMHWAALGDRSLVSLADQLLAHLSRILNICSHVIEEQTPGPPPTKPTLPSLPNAPSLSPIKRKAKGLKDDTVATKDSPQSPIDKTAKSSPKEAARDVEKEKSKKDGLGTFYNIPHYMKMYDVLRGAYSNYKISLDLNSSEKFGSLLRTALQVLAQVLEVAGLTETGKCAEELLGYLKITVTMEDTTSVLCVQQLLKSLFGTNLAAQWESSPSSGGSRKPGKATRLTSSIKPGLYHSCFTTPYTQFTQCLASATFRTTSHVEQEESNSLIACLKKKAEKKIPAILKPGNKTDRASVASYIRLFEPLVIKALKQYTITSSLALQQQVLNLLSQLVQLRVNYCLLDSDQIFIGFVIKQFEYVEEGQVSNAETLVPHIFNFLLLLSYEKYHSKTIIGMPKIIQLCDGIMASGQDPATHAIPALQPIVHDLFVMRSASKGDATRDLDTQREVVVSMLLRLIHYYQVLEVFIVVLHQCHKEGEDKWKRLSRQVIDTVLPLLQQQQINLDSQVALDVVHRLFESVAPSVFRPVDIVLKTLFAPPHNLSTTVGLQRWVCLVLSLLRVLIAQSKEEMVLSRLHELNLAVQLRVDTVQLHRQQITTKMTPIKSATNKITPEETFGRFLFQVIGVVVSEIRERSVSLTCADEPYSFLCQELAHLLLYITHMFQSGIYRRVATTAMSLCKAETPDCMFTVRQINKAFRDLNTLEPMLTIQWCNILILLNYDDQAWWVDILQTQRKYKVSSPSHPDFDTVESILARTRSCNMEIVRRGGLILFCDYVCENLNDAEHMTWVIINHVSDLIQLSQEPPVQDFISAIHRNPAASGLFIQAIHSRCENLSKPSLVRKTLHCLEGIHLSQSGALLTLLIDKFINTHHLSVARICDTIACRRVEMLLAETIEESRSQLPLEDLEKLLQFMKSAGLPRRHTRLASLLKKLRNLMCPDSCLALSPEKTHPLVLTSSSVTEIEVNKDWFISITRDQCYTPGGVPRECAKLLQHLDYTNILSIIMAKECQVAVLEECIGLGIQRTLSRLEQSTNTSPENSPSRGQMLDPLLQAAQITLFRHVNSVINMLPVPHKLICYDDHVTAKEEHYNEKMEDYFTDSNWFDTVFHLANALLQYSVSLPMLPWQPSVPEESLKDVARFSILTMELIHWMLKQDQFPSSEQMQTVLECFSLVLQKPELEAVIGQKEQTTWVCAAVKTIYQILLSVVVLPGDRLVILPNQDAQEDMPDVSFDDVQHAVRACDQISELVHCLKTHLNPNSLSSRIPEVLVAPIRNIIIGLARMPLVNSYARTPPLVWKLGWMPSPSGDMKTRLPPLPLDFLQDKEVLHEFIFRVRTIGWTSRQQFEETWMSLLGVLNPLPVSEGQRISPEEDMERCQCQVLGTRCITSLLIQSTLTPHSGNPCNSRFEHQPRDKPLAFLHTRVGKKLAIVRVYIEAELRNLAKHRVDLESHHPYAMTSKEKENSGRLFVNNLEREVFIQDYGLGQLSVESIWSLLGMLDPGQLGDSSSDSNTDSPSPANSPPAIYPPVQKSLFNSQPLLRSAANGGLDIHSCLQFLLELYGQLLASNANPRSPLMLINEVVRSFVVLSDVFTEKQQYELMLNTLLNINKVHAAEDEIVAQYLTVGICKAAAIVGTDINTSDRIVKMIDSSLKSTHLPTKVAALHGSLYLLETGISELIQQIIPIVSDYVIKTLSGISSATIHSQQHVLVMWVTAFYIIENYQEEVRDTELTSKLLQVAVTAISSVDEVTPLTIYLAVIRGLERILLADVLSRQDADVLIKLSVERLSLASPQRSLAALGLMLTCMYSGKHGDDWSPTTTVDNINFMLQPQVPQDPESLIVAMERVTVLFDRIRKGFPYEARVITRLLPTFLSDFFPPQDIMNKVIGEFLSGQQPHPQLMAKVVFQVFHGLLQKDQEAVVKDWVMLSLSNFTQRTPVAMAIWSLTCFFVSASTNHWLRALLPHIIGRMGKMEGVDRKLFCVAALDFRKQLTDEQQLRAFYSTFQTVALPGTPYADLLACRS